MCSTMCDAGANSTIWPYVVLPSHVVNTHITAYVMRCYSAGTRRDTALGAQLKQHVALSTHIWPEEPGTGGNLEVAQQQGKYRVGQESTVPAYMLISSGEARWQPCAGLLFKMVLWACLPLHAAAFPSASIVKQCSHRIRDRDGAFATRSPTLLCHILVVPNTNAIFGSPKYECQ